MVNAADSPLFIVLNARNFDFIFKIISLLIIITAQAYLAECEPAPNPSEIPKRDPL